MKCKCITLKKGHFMYELLIAMGVATMHTRVQLASQS